ALNEADGPRVTWSGRTRPAIDDLEVVPRPVHGSLPIWVATGGNPSSALRTGQMGLPLSFGIIGGTFSRFARQVELYRRAAAQAGHAPERARVSVGSFGLVAPTTKEALERYYPGWYAINLDMGRLRGWAEPDQRAYLAQAQGEGAYVVGDPDGVAER